MAQQTIFRSDLMAHGERRPFKERRLRVRKSGEATEVSKYTTIYGWYDENDDIVHN
jgi:hypothetical protein